MSNTKQRTTLSDEERETLVELIHIGMGRACASINQMVLNKVKWKIPIIPRQEDIKSGILQDKAKENLVMSSLNFSGDLTGHVDIMFSRESGTELTAILNEIEPKDVDPQTMVETLNEIANITVNSIVGTLSNLLQKKLDFKTPVFHDSTQLATANATDPSIQENVVVIAEFTIANTQVEGSFQLVFAYDTMSEATKKIREKAS
ncbi:MAG: hypothetical protein OXT67_05470 [Zetaproteobacteria bacterium]|nr:hypothetical protein [Zetaproteobacteria bacterium]